MTVAKRAVTLIVALFACLAISLSLMGCQKEASPSEVLGEILTATQNMDSEELAKYGAEQLGSDADSIASGLAGSNGTELSDNQQKMVKAMVSKIVDFEYTLGEEKIDGNTATVEVTFKTYDFSDAMLKATETFADNVAASVKNGSYDQSKLEDNMYGFMADEFDALDKRTVEKSTVFTLTKGSDGWQLDTITDDNKDAMLGGLLSNISSTQSEMEKVITDKLSSL
jgi:hypothetical protein